MAEVIQFNKPDFNYFLNKYGTAEEKQAYNDFEANNTEAFARGFMKNKLGLDIEENEFEKRQSDRAYSN